MKIKVGLAVLVLAIATAAAAQAETRYVSDQLIITLRSSKGSDYQVVKSLKTDTPVEVLEEDREFARIRTQSGEEGYVLKQYLTRETPKAEIITRLEKDVASLRGQLDAIDKRRKEVSAELSAAREGQAETESELKEQFEALTLKLAQTEKEFQTVSGQYEDLRGKSENVLQLSQEADRLEEENQRILTEVEQLRQENESLLRTGMIQWFLAGGGVFFIGWIAGKFSRKKRRSSF